MGYNKITNLLGKLDKDEIPKFTTIEWIEIFDQSNGTYNINKDIRFKMNQLRNIYVILMMLILLLLVKLPQQILGMMIMCTIERFLLKICPLFQLYPTNKQSIN